MITQNDLLDMKFVFCNIRISPAFYANERVLLALISELNSPLDSDNKFREALSKVGVGDNNHWSFVYHRNLYAYSIIIKDSLVYQVLGYSLEYLLECIRHADYEKVAAVADTLHNLPIDICENSYKIPPSFFENEVKYYQLHWDFDFLKAIDVRMAPSKGKSTKKRNVIGLIGTWVSKIKMLLRNKG